VVLLLDTHAIWLLQCASNHAAELTLWQVAAVRLFASHPLFDSMAHFCNMRGMYQQQPCACVLLSVPDLAQLIACIMLAAVSMCFVSCTCYVTNYTRFNRCPLAGTDVFT
jgi:hypothetical protein